MDPPGPLQLHVHSVANSWKWAELAMRLEVAPGNLPLPFLRDKPVPPGWKFSKLRPTHALRIKVFLHY
jgi:formylmethanofuran dehydrogenase subunit A